MKIAICLIVKNEVRNIGEWIAYYMALGVDAVIIFDNNSTDGTAALVLRAAKIFDVRLVPWERTDCRSQMAAYEYAAQTLASEFDWLGFFDADEFFVLHRETLHSFLTRPSDCGAVGINWAIFGSNGHRDSKDALVVKTFTRRAEAGFFPNRHIKSFTRPHAVRSCMNPHFFDIEGSYLSPVGLPLEWLFVEAGNYYEPGLTQAEPDFSVCQLNHYFVRSHAHWVQKVSRGYSEGISVRHEADFDYYDRNEVEDFSALAQFDAVLMNVAKIYAQGRPQ